jgi:predicted nucleic acid-binding protein
MSIVVSDTSPIRAFGHLGLIDLLCELYEEVLIPPAVDAELRDPAWELETVDVRAFSFIRIQAPADREQVDRFRTFLDAGESEALALALEVHAGLVLIDEAAGRAAVSQLGFVPVGVLGSLARAKEKGLLGAIAPLIDRLQNEIRFFVSPKLRTAVLQSVGELP